MSFNHLILIDDDHVYLALLKRQLNRAGVDNPLVFFSEGESFLNYLWENQRDEKLSSTLIILDLHLSSTSGMDLLETIQVTPQLADLNLSIIVNTSSRNPDDRSRCFGLGCMDYYIKSSDNKGLIETIKAYLGADIINCCTQSISFF